MNKQVNKETTSTACKEESSDKDNFKKSEGNDSSEISKEDSNIRGSKENSSEVGSSSEIIPSEISKEPQGKSKRRKRRKKITYDPHPVRNKLRKLNI